MEFSLPSFHLHTKEDKVLTTQDVLSQNISDLTAFTPKTGYLWSLSIIYLLTIYLKTKQLTI